jgi:hypothetical protein
VARASANLIEHIQDQIRFLEASGTAFDAGHDGEAKRLATVVRVLLHDTNNSKSLLGQAKVKERMSYLNTAAPFNPRNLMSHTGLVMMKLTTGPDPNAGGEYVPLLGEGSPEHQNRPSPFTHWWQELVIKDNQGNTWTRQDVVLELANKEGGAHVDPTLTKKYEASATNNALGWMYTEGPDDVGTPFKGNPVFASMRQIAYEVEMTLNRELPNRIPGFA